MVESDTRVEAYRVELTRTEAELLLRGLPAGLGAADLVREALEEVVADLDRAGGPAAGLVVLRVARGPDRT